VLDGHVIAESDDIAPLPRVRQLTGRFGFWQDVKVG
jgi:hypothetical protein